MHQFATVTGQFAAEFGESAKSLVVRIAFELQYHGFVAEIFQLFENRQTCHQPNGFGRPAYALAIMFSKGLTQFSPGDRTGQAK